MIIGVPREVHAEERRVALVPDTVVQLQKLGFKGFPQFHKALLQELQAKVSGPTQRRDAWASEAPAAHLLNRFSQAVTHNLEQTFSHVDSDRFDASVALLSRTEGQLYIVGGRITRSLADYAFTHFQAIRARVTHLTSSSATWPHYVLDMTEGDTLLIFDIRRYEENLLRLAEIAQARGMQVILITDQWSSPIASVAAHTFNCWVEIPSAWDSTLAINFIIEALIAEIQTRSSDSSAERIAALEGMIGESRIFRGS